METPTTQTTEPVQDEAKTVLLGEMIKAGVHFGHAKSKRHPNMRQFLFGVRNNISIIDVERTLEQIEKAGMFLKDVRENGGSIIFVNTKPETRAVVLELAKELGQYYVTERWLGGMLTNFETLKRRLDHYEDLLKKKASGELARYTKKEQSMFAKETADLEKKFAGVKGLQALPKALFIVDIVAHETALEEAEKVGIPVVAIVDTNGDPERATVAIPANDDTPASVSWVLNKVKERMTAA